AATAAQTRRWDLVSGQAVGTPLSGHAAPVQCLAFAPDGRTLATGSADHTVRLWDATTGQPRGEPLAGHTDRVLDVAFSPDGRLLASGGLDRAVRLWEVASGRLLANLYSLAGGQRFLALTPSGYYHGSLDIGSLVRWRIGPATYPFDQFAERFHRPDVVRQALAGEDTAAAALTTQVPPALRFITPRYGAEVPGRQVEVRLLATGAQVITRVELTVNGRALPPAVAQELVADPEAAEWGGQREFRVTVPLPVGAFRARLRAVAHDSAQLCSPPAELLVVAPNAAQQPAALRLLAIGINRYAHLPEQYQLRYAVPDAEALAAALARLGNGQPYAAVHPVVLTDARATLANLKLALRDLKDSATEGDVAVVFISGHGVTADNETFYFPTHDVRTDDLQATALSAQDFVTALREIRARQVLVLADTCHSGGIVGGRALDSDLLAERLNRTAHQMVFTAAAQDEVSIGRETWGHGAFSYALLQAIAGEGDANRDGALSYAELRDFVTARVTELTAGQQHPQLPFLDRFEPDALFARVPARRR
ncbi:MAG: caspase family protein, partial [Armatimonadetes bacterium]|nr:caspase family protein [Armatimonadota bacterium]